MNMGITAAILPVMAIGCFVAALRFYGGARLFLRGCGVLNLVVLLMVLAKTLH